MSNNGRILAKKRFERSARRADEGSMASEVDVLIRRIRIGSFYRSAMKVWRTARKTLLVSRIIKYVTVLFSVLESGAIALLSGAVFLVALPVCLLPACILEIRASIAAKRERSRVVDFCRGKHVVVLRGDFTPDAYADSGRAVIRVRRSIKATVYGAESLTVSTRLYIRLHRNIKASAARLIEVY